MSQILFSAEGAVRRPAAVVLLSEADETFVRIDPQEFLSNLAERDEAGQRRLWANFFNWIQISRLDCVVTAGLVEAALESLETWSSSTHDNNDRFWQNAIHGAFLVLRRATGQGTEHDDLIPTRLLELLGCENVWIAGISLRYFEWFPPFRDRCLADLVEAAFRDRRCTQFAPHGIDGIAFVVLWGLSPELARLPKLLDARQHCIAAHLERARDLSDNLKYRELYEQYCLVANELMWF